ncbi:hypothetical protein ABEB36_015783 [Hypothenemus hampei]|uniref:Uncharacterized protein n=1 Tax=Hypothenemus hampei TaxID=57062 RepID=A0ABD1DZ19_HYPHA
MIIGCESETKNHKCRKDDKKKYLALKLERDENDIAINKVLTPLTTPLRKIVENTLPTDKKRQKINAGTSPSSSTVKAKIESSDTVKEEEKINNSASISNQQQQHQQQPQLQQQNSDDDNDDDDDDDENNYDDAIDFDKSIDERNMQTF